MDFSTLRTRLQSGQVTTVAQFKSQLDLIWQNCLTFNGPIAIISLTACEARRQIDDHWAAFSVPAASHALQNLIELQTALSNLDKMMSVLFPMPPRPPIPAFSLPKPPPKVVEPPKEKPVGPVPNHAERKAIAERMKQAPVSEMRRAWDVIKPHIDRAALEQGRLSLDSLPGPVLAHLKELVMR
jgi:hypothetical protein